MNEIVNIREYTGDRAVLYCPDGLYNGVFPYIMAYLKPSKIARTLNECSNYSPILFSWSYAWQDIGWFNKVCQPILVGGKHAELLAFNNKLPHFSNVTYWTKRLDAQDNPNDTIIVPDYGVTLIEQPFVEWLIVYSGEGCYWRKCTFCNVDYPFPYKQFNPEYIAKIVLEANKFGKIGGLSGEAHTISWMEEMESYLPLGKRYDAYARADQKGWSRLKKINKVFIGLEYLSDSVLKRVKKGVNAKQIMDTILEIQSLGINVESVVIVDLWETEEEKVEHYQNTVKLLHATRRAGLKAGQFTLTETKLTPVNRNHYYIQDGEVKGDKLFSQTKRN